MTFREALNQGTALLKAAGVPEAELDASYLLEFVWGIGRHDFFLKQNECVKESEWLRYKELLLKRAKRMPLQHIIGETEFMGLPFYVNRDVLIPRQDTECLVERVLPFAKAKSVLDMCTGSGCIGISIAKLCPETRVTAVDVSDKALQIASENAKRNEVKVTFVESDLFEQITGRYDLIVSNPPYIEHEEIQTLMPEVRDYEPASALDGGEDGLDFYRKITSQASEYLACGGMLAFEIGYNQGRAVEALMKEQDFFDIEIGRDYAGLDRMVVGRRK